MTMLHADSAEFRERYLNNARVFDAWGRRIPYVQSCNLETGEVIRCLLTRSGSARASESGCCTRHGFWPAPLRVVGMDLWPGGPAPDGQPYIVGNGDREVLMEPEV